MYTNSKLLPSFSEEISLKIGDTFSADKFKPK